MNSNSKSINPCRVLPQTSCTKRWKIGESGITVPSVGRKCLLSASQHPSPRKGDEIYSTHARRKCFLRAQSHVWYFLFKYYIFYFFYRTRYTVYTVYVSCHHASRRWTRVCEVSVGYKIPFSFGNISAQLNIHSNGNSSVHLHISPKPV